MSSTLFGAGGADDADRAFFAGNKADYYDARNSYLDQVLERRCGIPISLSLVYAETCGRLDCEMVGLNAPAHLLLGSAGDGGGDHIVVDCFDGGRILDLDAAADLVASNAGFGEDEGAELLGNLRALPMTSRQWASRVLRNLKAVHLAADDTVPPARRVRPRRRRAARELAGRAGRLRAADQPGAVHVEVGGAPRRGAHTARGPPRRVGGGGGQ